MDQYFVEKFLPNRLKGMAYHNIMSDQTRHGQGAHRVLRREEQKLLDDFMHIKHEFRGRPGPGEDPYEEFLPLPQNLTGIQAGAISNGNLRITWFVWLPPSSVRSVALVDWQVLTITRVQPRYGGHVQEISRRDIAPHRAAGLEAC
ncbi:hypothetical protein IMZ48_48445 [Candidatus Bathyarchaeota archaeon]|nr:hypothetical protein [Candidatus Bathyarchaeota archaeon]